MNELQVINHKGTQAVDSREVAEMVGKEHKNLLRDINGYIETMKNAGNLNGGYSNGGQLKIEPSDFFIESTYTNSQNKEMPCYLLTKKGCDMVANKMTGEKGVLFTAAYVTAFERMREHIETGRPLPKSGKTDAQITAEGMRASAMLLNAKNRVADRLQRLYDRANVKPEYQALAIGEMFAEDGVKLPRIALAGTKVTYDKGTIADRLGILSKSGNPHAQAVGAIIADLQIEAEETEAVPFHRHGHDGTDVQYTESVIGNVDDWLARHGYPTTILGRAGKEFCIRYRDELISDHAR